MGRYSGPYIDRKLDPCIYTRSNIGKTYVTSHNVRYFIENNLRRFRGYTISPLSEHLLGRYHLSHVLDELLKPLETPSTFLSNHQHRFTTEDRHSIHNKCWERRLIVLEGYKVPKSRLDKKNSTFWIVLTVLMNIFKNKNIVISQSVKCFSHYITLCRYQSGLVSPSVVG